MRIARSIAVLVVIVLLLSSCSSIYVAEPEVTLQMSMEVDPDEEHFTLGNHHSKMTNDGVIYKDSFIYVEYQAYQEPITLPNGVKDYKKKTAQRIVKVNINTGVVSSVCLDPACSHSVDSNCPMLISSGTVGIQGVSGDWLVFSSFHMVAELNLMIPDTYVYNIITGELVKIFDYNINESIINTIGGLLLEDNKIYFIKNVLDYSKTDYQSAKKMDLDNYTPETKSFLYQFDLDSKKLSEIMEVPYGYTITAKTNSRLFFFNPTQGAFYGEMYSCNINGGDLTKEEVWNFTPQDFVGTYAYLCDWDNKKINIYDLRTNTQKVIETPYNYAYYYLTNEGIMLSTFADDDIYDEYLASRKDKEWSAWCEEGQKIRGESTGLIYLLDFDGSNQRLIYEKDKVELRGLGLAGEYVFGYAFYYDADNAYQLKNTENNSRALINIKTGEITMIPLLELIIPDEN